MHPSWSFTRVIWGVATLLVYVDNVELLQDTDTPVWSFIVLFVVFFVCEIVPIVILLDYSYYMQILVGGFLQEDSDAAPLLTTISSAQNGDRTNTEGDSLLLQRSIQTMDHLLLTSPNNQNQPRRVRFEDTPQAITGDPLLQPS